jgi:hypothetical protein
MCMVRRSFQSALPKSEAMRGSGRDFRLRFPTIARRCWAGSPFQGGQLEGPILAYPSANCGMGVRICGQAVTRFDFAPIGHPQAPPRKLAVVL